MTWQYVERISSVMNRLSAFIFVPLIAAAMAGVVSGAPLAVNDLDPRLAGYPQLTIRLTDERIEAPAAVPTGPTVLIEANATAQDGHAFVLRIPDDVTEAEVVEALTGGPLVREIPEWFWRAEFVGNGDHAAPDQTAVALVDLAPGRYLAGDPFRPRSQFARFEVTEDIVPAAARYVGADVTLDLFEMGFQLPETVRPGRHLWQVENHGAMVHEFAVLPVPAGASQADVETAASAMLVAEMGGDAATARAAIDALGAAWAGWNGDAVAGMGVLSPGHTAFVQVALEPGTYAIVCYVPEPASGTPHLMLGMSDVFTVGAS
jgi:hypothetical protein